MKSLFRNIRESKTQANREYRGFCFADVSPGSTVLRGSVLRSLGYRQLRY